MCNVREGRVLEHKGTPSGGSTLTEQQNIPLMGHLPGFINGVVE